MARIEPLDPELTEGRARELLDDLAARGTEPGPMVRAMANAPALLRGYLDLTRAMKRSHLDRRVSERILPRGAGVARLRLLRRGAQPGGSRASGPRPDRGLQPRRRHPLHQEREECRMTDSFTAWAAAVGAAGCGRCAIAA
jgi:hypothetical protein